MDSALVASLADAGLAAAIVAALALPAVFRGRLLLALLAVLLAFGDDFITDWGHYKTSPLNLIAGSWNWNGKAFDLVFLVLAAFVLVASGLFNREQLGLAWRQKRGTFLAVLLVIVPFIAIVDAIVIRMSGHQAFTWEDVAFQMTMPGFTEELFYRGLLLALFDRMFATPVKVLGTELGYGAIATSLAFAAVHAIGVDKSLHLTFEPLAAASPLVGAFVAVWIRARSGSLVVPMLAHNISNTVVTVVPGFI